MTHRMSLMSFIRMELATSTSCGRVMVSEEEEEEEEEYDVARPANSVSKQKDKLYMNLILQVIKNQKNARIYCPFVHEIWPLL